MNEFFANFSFGRSAWDMNVVMMVLLALAT
jgi:hypothetical protein